MKREAELKAAAMRELKRQEPRYIVLLLATAGGPDRVIVGNGKVTAWEFKHATPDFKSPDLQELFAMRLDAHGLRTRYVVWQERADGTDKQTLIITPMEMYTRQNYAVSQRCEDRCSGYDHRWLVEQILRAHA